MNSAYLYHLLLYLGASVNKYTRDNPSPRYIELLSLYKQLHVEGIKEKGLLPENTFPGQSLPPQAIKIKRLIDISKAETILDYGAGKGLQYGPMKIQLDGRPTNFESILEFWKVKIVHCYDPGYSPFSTLPDQQFDGVISTDVLEHCPEEDIYWVINEIFRFSIKFVFANIACYPALKTLPNGENAHCTIKPINWWQAIIEEISECFPNVMYEFFVVDMTFKNGQKKYNEKVLRNF